MAGFGRHLLRTDPAIEKYGRFSETMSLYYKVNAKSVSIAVLYLAIIPVSLIYVGYKYQDLNFIGKRRDKPVYNHEYIPRK